ncbi:hypothetical protein HPULCUR_010267 [Helicostylum pulchrum]|uniref:Protein Zds1 C-terminal domain-containing protein n=1 Tax=Helicostylum pulchrum TaxID=562976 RepID=A0ABP9YD72_9FUNG
MQLDIESKNIFELRSQFTINYSKYKSESLQDDITNQSSNPIWPADKHPLPNEFDLWIKTHANESGPNIPSKIQRKRSVLSMVSFLEESSSDDEEEEEQEEKQQDQEQAPLTPPRENFPTLPVLNQSDYHVNIPERKIPRYPLDMERAVYQLSHLKLNNIRRPLQQQVVISNMMYWYLSITEQIEYQQPPPLQKEGDDQRPTSPPLTHISSSSTTTQYQQPVAAAQLQLQQGEHRPASPPPPSLNDVSTKSSKKKYKPVPNTEYVSGQKY